MRRVALFLGALALAVAVLWFLPPSGTPPSAGGVRIEPTTTAESREALSGPERGVRSPVVRDAGAAISDATEKASDPDQSVHASHRIEVLDVRGDPVPSAVAIQENSTGDLIGFAADAQGWIEIPSRSATGLLRVTAAGFLPAVFHGILLEDRVVLSQAIRVQVEIEDGWQRLTEGWPEFQIKGSFDVELEPPRDPSLGLFEGPPSVEVRFKDGSKKTVVLATIEAVLLAPVSPMGLATFWVHEPGEYTVKIKWKLIRSEESEGSFLISLAAVPEIVVRPDETDQNFRVHVPPDRFSMMLEAFSITLEDD